MLVVAQFDDARCLPVGSLALSLLITNFEMDLFPNHDNVGASSVDNLGEWGSYACNKKKNSIVI